MSTKIKSTFIDGKTTEINLSDKPTQCPKCKMMIMAIERFASHSYELINVAFNCPACHEMFLGNYWPQGHGYYKLLSVEPIRPNTLKFSTEIETTSPQFVKIFNQANAAEDLKLDQIAGMGYRKALEFLIKDYLIRIKPLQKDEIQSMLLGACITNHIDDVNIKETAKRAAWIGNDETHYLRKWEDRDINDLKLLIRLMANWIENHLLTMQYVLEMDRGK
jgi:hypothetical protein